jgi:hypothetical protein
MEMRALSLSAKNRDDRDRSVYGPEPTRGSGTELNDFTWLDGEILVPENQPKLAV